MSKLKNVRTLTTTAMLISIGILLGFFKIPITNAIEIRFTQIPLASIGVLFGPAVAAVSGIIMDIGQFLVKPTGPYFPGFTLSSAVTGLVFGLMLHKKTITFQRILITQILYTIIVGIVLNSVWLSMLYENAFMVILTARLLKEIVMIPVNAFILLAIIKPVSLIHIKNKQGMAVK